MELTDPILVRELDRTKVINIFEPPFPKVKVISNITFEFLKTTAYDYSDIVGYDELVKKSAILDSKIILTAGTVYEVYDLGNKWVIDGIIISAHTDRSINHYTATEIIRFPGFLELPSWVFIIK